MRTTGLINVDRVSFKWDQKIMCQCEKLGFRPKFTSITVTHKKPPGRIGSPFCAKICSDFSIFGLYYRCRVGRAFVKPQDSYSTSCIRGALLGFIVVQKKKNHRLSGKNLHEWAFHYVCVLQQSGLLLSRVRLILNRCDTFTGTQ